MLYAMSVPVARSQLSANTIVIFNENYPSVPRLAKFALNTTNNRIFCQVIEECVHGRRVSEFTIVKCIQVDETAHRSTDETSVIWEILQAKNRQQNLAFFQDIWENFTNSYEMDIAPDLQLYGKQDVE